MSHPFERLTAEQRDQLVEEPLPDWLDPMLATLTDDHFSDAAWLYERKLDGERAIAYRSDDDVRILSRNATELDDTYPELHDAIRRASTFGCVVDGEVVAFEGALTSFSKLQPRLQISDPEQARNSDVAVYFYLFDVLHLDGRSTRALPLRTRKSLLRDAVAFADPLRWVSHRNEHGERWFEEACAKGWEGLIAKRAAAAYRHGRSREWLKFKCINRQEFVIGGFTEPEGARERFGALLVGYHAGNVLRYAGKVGTGYYQQTLHQLGDQLEQRERRASPFDDGPDGPGVHFVTPDLVAEIGFTEWTDDGRLRHPRYLGLREDKEAQDVVRETPD